MLMSFYMGLISLISLMMSFMMNFLSMTIYYEWNIYMLNSFSMEFIIFIDWMSLMFLSTVLIISSMILIYSMDYMKYDININRFMMMVVGFVLSMIMMILSPSLLSILLGWDGLGLISYCLVIYYQNYFSYYSGMITVLMNRIGDVMLLMSIGLMIYIGSFNLMNYYNYGKIIMFMIIIASFTKSAQIPFSSWLTAAMAAPTPVSSLVHSSTLVTAGIYLLIRFNNLIMESNFLQKFITIMSVMTMFVSGMSAMFQNDFKKIIALSTLSQLGLMMSSLSMGMIIMSYFHLLMHALFKSLMFMCAGQIIHKMMNFQDIRKFGSVVKFMPFVSICFFSSSMALMGFPFLSGYFSKDLILEFIMMMNYNFFLVLLYFLSMLFTIMYSIRLMMISFMKNYMFMSFSLFENLKFMNISMIILYFMSMFMGSILSWLFMYNLNLIVLMKETKMFLLLWLLLFMLLMKLFIDMELFVKKFINIKFFIYKMFNMDNFSIEVINILKFGNLYYKIIEKGWNELYSGQGVIYLYIYLMKYFMKFKYMNFLIFIILYTYMIVFILLF
uniref:NADH:ubiquinone reductase (H(+)-translocating) n=2 Tax=Schlettererius cinctipes TaxID=32424 RepID=C4NCG2_9HYME|nr:NADH dehydrogenase subunit 5 [Schlettererius cinctipes]